MCVEWLWRQLRRLSFYQTALFVVHLLIVGYLACLTPLFLRWAFAARFIKHEEPLEFTFHTCRHELAGACSFPEAMVALDQVGDKAASPKSMTNHIK